MSLQPHVSVVTKTEFIPEKKRNKVFVGAGVGRSLDQFGLTANVMLFTKREHAYQLSYDVLNNDMYFTMYWKLKFKRRGR
jgi:hypothetical protein